MKIDRTKRPTRPWHSQPEQEPKTCEHGVEYEHPTVFCPACLKQACQAEGNLQLPCTSNVDLVNQAVKNLSHVASQGKNQVASPLLELVNAANDLLNELDTLPHLPKPLAQAMNRMHACLYPNQTPRWPLE